MDKGIKQVVVLLAHPDIKSSQANKALMDAIKELEEVAVYNLYEIINRKTFCDAFPNHFVSILHLLTQNELRFFIHFPTLLKGFSKSI